jgi:hypothetical protein
MNKHVTHQFLASCIGCTHETLSIPLEPSWGYTNKLTNRTMKVRRWELSSTMNKLVLLLLRRPSSLLIHILPATSLAHMSLPSLFYVTSTTQVAVGTRGDMPNYEAHVCIELYRHQNPVRSQKAFFAFVSLFSALQRVFCRALGTGYDSINTSSSYGTVHRTQSPWS